MVGSIFRRTWDLGKIRRQLRASQAVSAAGDDSELELYASIFQSDFLHAGYFLDPSRDPETVSFAEMRDAMRACAELLVRRVAAGDTVLDVGCGQGGVLGLLRQAGAVVTGLTPSARQAAHVRKRYPDVQVIECRFESLDTAPLRNRFDAIACVESFHNISLEAGLRNIRELARTGGKCILLDYYRLREDTYNRSGHLLRDFQAAIDRHRFRVDEELDITENVLPSIAFAFFLATRLGLPLAAFARRRLARRRQVLSHLLSGALDRLQGKLHLDALDPDVFQRDKRYLLHRLSI